jgi:transcription elongation factor Elf1
MNCKFCESNQVKPRCIEHSIGRYSYVWECGACGQQWDIELEKKYVDDAAEERVLRQMTNMIYED